MTNHHFHDLLPEGFDPSDLAQVDVILAEATSPHMDALIDDKVSLLRFHAMLHAVGHDDTSTHDRCLERIAETDDLLDRGWKALWC